MLDEGSRASASGQPPVLHALRPDRKHWHLNRMNLIHCPLGLRFCGIRQTILGPGVLCYLSLMECGRCQMMARKQGIFLGVLTTDPLPMSNSLSLTPSAFTQAVKSSVVSCPLQNPLWVPCQMPPHLPHSVWQGNQVSRLAGCWL